MPCNTGDIDTGINVYISPTPHEKKTINIAIVMQLKATTWCNLVPITAAATKQ